MGPNAAGCRLGWQPALLRGPARGASGASAGPAASGFGVCGPPCLAPSSAPWDLGLGWPDLGGGCGTSARANKTGNKQDG